jgi:hypothetical protein
VRGRLLLVWALVLALALVFGVAGCSGGDDSGDSGDSGDEASGSAVIVLEEGWAMQDVISAEEVGEIVGATMVYFPEANADSAGGRPSAGYTQESVENSKIGFSADLTGGAAEELEIQKGYAVEGTLEEIPGLGDEAYALNWDDGRTGVILVTGDAFIRISWPEGMYGNDTPALGTELANLLMSKMYGE